MRTLRMIALALSALAWAGGGMAGPLDDASASAERVKAHMAFLASDLLEGRGTGERGHELAAAYVAAQLAQLGVKPAGEGGSYFQPVPIVSFRPAQEGRIVLRTRGAPPAPLLFGDDYVPGRTPISEKLVRSAPLVFAGLGVVAPEAEWDDYRGLDVKGKIVVVMLGAPSSLPSEPRAYYGSIRTKQATAAARGAVGLVLVQTPEGERRRPFSRAVDEWRRWDSTWREPGGDLVDPGGKAPLLALLSLGGAAKVFAGSPSPLDQVYGDLESGRQRSFPLPAALDADLTMELKPLHSANVVGMVEGADPALRGEVVVLSAHLDHLGMKAGGSGDVIFNGAMDNASGVATTLEVARAFAEAPPPRRTVVFLLDTAEEQSMAGSQIFARFPTAPGRLVAEVNLDMPVLTYDFVDVVAFGAERSSLGPAVRRAAEQLGVALSPDPVPQEGLFTRSDHFSFVEQGVPSIYLMTGFGGDGARAFGDFIARHYHKPSDDLSLPIDYRFGAKFARLNYEIARSIADADASPAWAAGDFFGELFANPQRQATRPPRDRRIPPTSKESTHGDASSEAH